MVKPRVGPKAFGELPKVKLPDGFEAKVMAENARALYRLPVCSGSGSANETALA